MRSKLQCSIAELHKLKNQIRVELNQIRPRGSPLHISAKEHSAKRLDPSKFTPTDIVHPSAEKSQEGRDRKRYYHTGDIQHCDASRPSEKRHFGRHYSDSVDLEMQIKRRKSAYLNIRKVQTAATTTRQNPCPTSLLGIGLQDKSSQGLPRSCIRVYRNRQTSIG